MLNYNTETPVQNTRVLAGVTSVLKNQILDLSGKMHSFSEWMSSKKSPSCSSSVYFGILSTSHHSDLSESSTASVALDDVDSFMLYQNKGRLVDF